MIDVLDITGQKKGTEELNLTVDKLGAKEHVLYLVDKYQKALLRQGTASVKGRSDVRGGGAKPYKQKGTGRARMGTKSSPLRRGGGVVFGPQPRDFSIDLNKKTITKSIKMLLSEREPSLVILDDSVSKKTDLKTKEMKSFLMACNVGSDKKAMFVFDFSEENIIRACRNLKNAEVTSVNFMPITTMLNCEKIIMSKKSFNQIKERFSK